MASALATSNAVQKFLGQRNILLLAHHVSPLRESDEAILGMRCCARELPPFLGTTGLALSDGDTSRTKGLYAAFRVGKFAVCQQCPGLDALVNQSGKEGRINHEIAKLGVEIRRRFGRNSVITQAPLLFERGDIFADFDKHVPKLSKLGFGADGFAVAGNNDGVVGGPAKLALDTAIIPSMLPPVE